MPFELLGSGIYCNRLRCRGGPGTPAGITASREERKWHSYIQVYNTVRPPKLCNLACCDKQGSQIWPTHRVGDRAAVCVCGYKRTDTIG